MLYKELTPTTIYISGKITGLVLNDALEIFQNAETELSQYGHTVINPMKIHGDLVLMPKAWSEYLKTDIKALLECEVIYMLHNHHDSKGANLELQIAQALGMKVIYQV